ncbi:tigger transposable element-derived protein 6-like [Montipora foliosa]|uniref:tigger transposable element-derived protein 6-like n=1 Tax=Montipora foliosa TaxID=591990 RepID=UPI0035F1C2C1
MLQEKALSIIAEKLHVGIEGFAASNGKHWCSGRKQSKQRNMWAFFVNAAGEKEDPIVIGQSERPRCFKALKDASRPYKCHYFANKKAWMNSDLMTDILMSLNRHLQLRQRKIMLFMDNAPCHPADLQDKLSNINIVFLSKNTTSKTQPLDSGIIASWKCRYKKGLLRHVCSKVDGSNSASNIVKFFNLLMSIEWGRQAWDDVSRETIVKCFKRTGLYLDEVDEEDDPFEGEEVSGLQELVTAMEVSCTAEEFLAAEDEIQICSGLFDSADPKWREKAREEILKNHKSISTEATPAKQFHVEDSDEEEDKTTKEPAIKSENEALRLSEMLLEYSRYHGQEDLTLAISKATDLH